MNETTMLGKIDESSLDPASVPVGIFDYDQISAASPEVRVISGRDFRVLDDGYVDNDLEIGNDLAVLNDCDVTGACTVGSTLGVTGEGTFETDVEIKGQLTISGASRVRVTKNDAQTIQDNTMTKVEYDDEVYDNLGEWNTTNNNFTAKAAGVYHVVAALLSAEVNWDPGERAYLTIYVNNTLYSLIFRDEVDAAVNKYFFAFGSDDVTLAVDDVLDIRVKYVRGAATDTYPNSIYNYVAIHRLS